MKNGFVIILFGVFLHEGAHAQNISSPMHPSNPMNPLQQRNLTNPLNPLSPMRPTDTFTDEERLALLPKQPVGIQLSDFEPGHIPSLIDERFPGQKPTFVLRISVLQDETSFITKLVAVIPNTNQKLRSDTSQVSLTEADWKDLSQVKSWDKLESLRLQFEVIGKISNYPSMVVLRETTTFDSLLGSLAGASHASEMSIHNPKIQTAARIQFSLD